MHHPHRHRPVVGTGFFDAEVLEPVFHVLQRRAAEELGNAEIKGVGQLFKVIQTDVALAALDGADVGAVKPGMLGQDLLRPAAGEAQDDVQG